MLAEYLIREYLQLDRSALSCDAQDGEGFEVYSVIVVPLTWFTSMSILEFMKREAHLSTKCCISWGC